MSEIGRKARIRLEENNMDRTRNSTTRTRTWNSRTRKKQQETTE
jgi:hypothetical protein